MRVLSYAPSFAAYVRASDGTTYDLTQDLSSCSVTRATGGASSFKISVHNPGGKYSGLFAPMDPVVIYASKGAPDDYGYYRLLTGYLTDVDRFKLYQSDMSMAGKDVLYRLQRLYWDPRLYASADFLRNLYGGLKVVDQGDYADGIRSLLIEVGGWPESMIFIDGGMPTEVKETAAALYGAQNEHYVQAESILEELSRMQVATLAQGADGTSVGGAGAGRASSEIVERAVQLAIQVANDDSHGYSWDNRLGVDYDCSSLVFRCLRDAGLDVGYVGNTSSMRSQLEPLGFAWHPWPFSEADLQRGDILLNEVHHTCWYIGGGQVVNASRNYSGSGDPYGNGPNDSGDPGGNEIVVKAYYVYDKGWDGFLRYTGD